MRPIPARRPAHSFRRPFRRTLVSVLLTVFVVSTLLAACSSASTPASAPANVTSADLPHAAAAPTAAPAAAAPSQDAAAKSGGAAAGAQSSAGSTANSPAFARMVIRSAKLSLQVANVEAALQKVRDIADAGGGYVSASHTYLVNDGTEDHMVADVTISVRSDAYNRSVEAIRQFATKVESEDGTSQDVTEEYVDLQANLRNLQASEDSLLKLTQQATRLDDILTLERELANVRGQIERIQGRMNYIQHNTDMSTISINLHLPPAKVTPFSAPNWNPVATFQRGWKASLLALETVADGLISVVSFFWWLIPFAAAAVYLVRRNRRNRAAAAPPA